MNPTNNPTPLNQVMRPAYKAASIYFWVAPREAVDILRYGNWSEQISIELGPWFARIWNMAFASGHLGLKPFAYPRAHALRVLSKMDYTQNRASELADLLLGKFLARYLA